MLSDDKDLHLAACLKESGSTFRRRIKWKEMDHYNSSPFYGKGIVPTIRLLKNIAWIEFNEKLPFKNNYLYREKNKIKTRKILHFVGIRAKGRESFIPVKEI